MPHPPRVAILGAIIALLLAFTLTACQPPQPAPAAAATATSLPTMAPTATPTTAAPTSTPLRPTPEPPAAYPPPTPGRALTPSPYPAAAEAEVVQGRSIAILTLQPSNDHVQVTGSTTLPADACIQTWLYANGKVVAWWPTEQCAAIRDGDWVLSLERPALAEQTPPGARYTVIAKALDHPEAGEARLVMQAFIPYYGSGN